MRTDSAIDPKLSPPIFIGAESARQILLERLGQAKQSFVTRRCSFTDVVTLGDAAKPKAGDLILATVLEPGHHSRLELLSGRRAQLYPGDEIIVAYGARYAPDQFEAIVPDTLGPCDLVAGGGIAATTLTRHSQTRKATTIAPIGVLKDAGGETLNLARYAMAPSVRRAATRNVVAVVGTSMNAGKTTLASHLIRGLSRGGIRVGACKVTGTGSGGDLWSMIDAGAVAALDFTDAGHATTSGLPPSAVEATAHLLVSELEGRDIDIVVVEIADGLLQRETAALLSAPSSFASRLDSVVLAASDSMGAKAGVEWLRARGLPLCAISGLLTASPLATREAEAATGIEIIPTKAFADPDRAARLCLATPPSSSDAAS